MRLTAVLAFWILAIAHSFDIIAIAPDLPNHGQSVGENTLVQHKFENSFGQPATAQYSPPSSNFSHVQLELDFSTYGNQYDRLGHIYLNNVEIWRFSTPEPGGKTISATMSKDVSQYVSLFAQSGTLTFQLDNVVDATYTGPLQCSLKVKYFKTDQVDTADTQWYYSDKAPSVVSSLQNGGLAYSPPDMSFSIPKVSSNTYRAGMTIYASGNSREEFYYTNAETGNGPTRLIQVYVNGQLAGIVDPFQPIYTGGIQPHLWYPIVGVNAYDLPSYYIDLSPWLPLLWKQDTQVQIKITNGYSESTVGDNWLLNAALMEWRDSSVQGTGGSQPQVQGSSSPATYISTSASSGHVGYVGLRNSVKLSSQLQFSDGSSRTVTWQQDITGRNAQLLGGGNTTGSQFYFAYQHGTSMYSGGSDTSFARTHEHAIGVYLNDKATTVDQSYIISNTGAKGVTSVNNNIRASWGTGGTDGTSGVVSWVENGAANGRAAQSQDNQESSTGQSGSGSGSWTTVSNDLNSLANDNNAEKLASQLGQMSGKYAQGSTEVLNE